MRRVLPAGLPGLWSTVDETAKDRYRASGAMMRTELGGIWPGEVRLRRAARIGSLGGVSLCLRGEEGGGEHVGEPVPVAGGGPCALDDEEFPEFGGSEGPQNVAGFLDGGVCG